MSCDKVLTIGYEGRTIDEFVSNLKSFNVTRLIDVREIPLSRKKGFSKSSLKERLESENIEYVHLRSLGSPSEIRDKVKMDSDYKYFFEAYSKYLCQNNDAFVTLYNYITTGINCIMCFERFPEKCHRSVIADKIREYDGNGLKIIHV